MDLICFSHLRWNFVYQRPQHLLTRFSNDYRVFYIEEPEHAADSTSPTLHLKKIKRDLWVVTPMLPSEFPTNDITSTLQSLLVDLFEKHRIHPDIFWYYTPMALKFTKGFHPDLVVYDCMDELSNFKFAPPELKTLEAELFEKAEIVFTGGHHLYSAKKHQHKNIWPVPSSIEKEHFMKARKKVKTPADQASIGFPRIGFYGVIDERFDLELLRTSAEQRPDWNFVILGPVIKIDEADLPRLSNIHYLGSKKYEELPAYLAGWQMAMIPFLLNDATKYISPTKTPEYLVAGVPVVSTRIVDVVTPYGDKGLAHIVDTADELIACCEKEFSKTDKNWLKKADDFLKNNSWDNTFQFMKQKIDKTGRKQGKVISISQSKLNNPVKTAINV